MLEFFLRFFSFIYLLNDRDFFSHSLIFFWYIIICIKQEVHKFSKVTKYNFHWKLSLIQKWSKEPKIARKHGFFTFLFKFISFPFAECKVKPNFAWDTCLYENSEVVGQNILGYQFAKSNIYIEGTRTK